MWGQRRCGENQDKLSELPSLSSFSDRGMRSAQAPSFLDARREASAKAYRSAYPLGRSLAAETSAGREWGLPSNGGKLHLIFKLARSR